MKTILKHMQMNILATEFLSVLTVKRSQQVQEIVQTVCPLPLTYQTERPLTMIELRSRALKDSLEVFMYLIKKYRLSLLLKNFRQYFHQMKPLDSAQIVWVHTQLLDHHFIEHQHYMSIILYLMKENRSVMSDFSSKIQIPNHGIS